MSTKQNSTNSAIDLLKKMIAIPSLSREEKAVADLIEQYLQENGISTGRLINNIYALNKYFDPSKQSILLNSHHDTVKPAKGYTTDPFTPTETEGRLIGLGSNDAGGPLVSLIATFIHFFERNDLPFNIILAATAEEEISGPNGVELLLKDDQFLDRLQGSAFMGALVGEPTKMEMAVAERGLLVLDGIVHGKAGHAAREEGINAIYLAIADIQAIATMDFEKTSDLLGKTTAKVTSIETDNKAHNVVPSSCRFVLDVRVNEHYGFDEVIDRLKASIKAELVPRSFRLRSSMIAMDHPIVKAGKQLGLSHYGSPTTSDKALMPFPALKIGPGDSSRSHTADEYIYISEIENGISGYIQLLETTISVY